MKNKIANLKYIFVDVDGTMTDGGIYYDETGNEIKKFCTKDAAGFFTAHVVGMKLYVLTGRECQATTRRLTEMGFDGIFQDVKNKTDFLNNYIRTRGIKQDEICYIGDDLNDYEPMKLAGFRGCPADSCDEVINIADYVSKVNGGYGAVRDVISYILKERNQWSEAISKVYGARTEKQ